MNRLIIVDPGLSEVGGHHFGFVLALLSYMSDGNGALKIEIYCSKEMPLHSVELPGFSDVEFKPFFSVNYYSVFGFSGDLLPSCRYVAELGAEYGRVLLDIEGELSDTLILFHSVGSWQAESLGWALDNLGRCSRIDDNFSCLVLFMFSPYSSDARACRLGELSFIRAVHRLVQIDNVSIYFSDYELKEYAQSLVSDVVFSSFQLHPCFLLGAGNHSRQYAEPIKNKVLFYCGDAKREKGFLELPELVLQVYESLGDKIEYHIQFSLNGESLALSDAKQRLLELANAYPAITVTDEYLNHEQLCDLLLDSFLVVFNYDPIEYKYKSSGFVWLAAYYKVPLLLLTNTWVTREVRRLGGSYISASSDTAHTAISSLLNGGCLYYKGGSASADSQRSYRSMLFDSFGDWVMQQFDARFAARK